MNTPWTYSTYRASLKDANGNLVAIMSSDGRNEAHPEVVETILSAVNGREELLNLVARTLKVLEPIAVGEREILYASSVDHDDYLKDEITTIFYQARAAIERAEKGQP